jgi:elongation factor Ts
MAEITAALVKELREMTGAGMMDCKKALQETNGELDAAVDWLRAKGLSKAAKKADRAASEGLVGVAVSGNAGAIIEFNAETDFVARNETFQKTAAGFAKQALDAKGDRDALLAAKALDGDGTNADLITRLIATIGENMNLRRVAAVSVNQGVIVPYIHNQVSEGLGRIGVLVALESTGSADALADIGRKVAQHIAAARPLALSVEDIPADVAAREKSIFAEQARESGKPENVIEKMIEGRMRKFYEESVLTKQTFVHDPEGKLTVEGAVKAAEKAAGAPIKLAGFARFELGEGVEKKQEDFAAEVAAAAKQA